MFLSRGGIIRPCRGRAEANFHIPLAVFCISARVAANDAARVRQRANRVAGTHAHPGFSARDAARARRLQHLSPRLFASVRDARAAARDGRCALAPQSGAVPQPFRDPS